MAFTTSFMILISLPLLLQFLSGTHSTTFTVINNCNYNVWPAILSNSGSPPISLTGFALSPSDSEAVPVPPNWSGRLWGRTHCAADINGKFTCLTGDCGTSAVECGGGSLYPPATTVEFSLNDYGTVNYLISVADGYNLPLMVVPQGGSAGPGGNCGTLGCVMDSNSQYFPKELRVTSSTGTGNDSTVAIKSACGGASGAGNCNPNSNSELFKKLCPQAQASAYDKISSSTCQSSDFVIHFCPAGFPATRTNGDNNGGGQGASSDDLGKDTSSTFGIVIGVVAGIIGLVLLIWLWHRYWKSGCEFHPCKCTCCGLFSCSICGDD